MVALIWLLGCGGGVPTGHFSAASPPERLIGVLDRNEDGRLSADELPEDSDIRMDFSTYDTDGDQRLDPDEVRFVLTSTSAKTLILVPPEAD